MHYHVNSLATLAAWSRFPKLRNYALSRTAQVTRNFSAKESALRVVFGGDVNFDPEIRMMWNLGLLRLNNNARWTFWRRARRKLWRHIVQPMLASNYYHPIETCDFPEFSVQKGENIEAVKIDTRGRSSKLVDLDLSVVAGDYDFPFRHLASFFKTKDLVVLNLETPLTDYPRDNGLFKSHPAYARALKAAGITHLNLSNNHIFDAGEAGFVDTQKHLDEARLTCLGVGKSFEAARAGTVVEHRGERLCFLSYTQFCNTRFASLASETVSGILPLDRQLMIEDIRMARCKADLVIVSLHWGIEDQPRVHPVQVEIAHQLVEAGADCIIGHHPHVVHAIEIYRQRPIIYSLGNLIFGQTHPGWGRDILVELVIAQHRIEGLLVHPVGRNLFQPELLRGREAEALLQELQIKSIVFRTGIRLEGSVGQIPIE